MKELYKFNVTVNREVPDVQTKEENGQTITVTSKIIKATPVEFVIKEPSRAEKEESELVRASFLSNFIRRGVMPEAVLAKIYSDMGGTENEADKKIYKGLTENFLKKLEEVGLIAANDKENKEKIELLNKEIGDIKREIANFQYQQKSFYSNTAEYKAKIKLIEYLFTLLTYWKKDDKAALVQYFEGKDFDKKLEHLEKLENDNDEIYNKMKDIALFIISVYIHSGGGIKKDELDELIKENFGTIS
jgi:hypothetical protein